jgi:hypothetical protein
MRPPITHAALLAQAFLRLIAICSSAFPHLADAAEARA